jgi:hypothetical protein
MDEDKRKSLRLIDSSLFAQAGLRTGRKEALEGSGPGGGMGVTPKPSADQSRHLLNDLLM